MIYTILLFQFIIENFIHFSSVRIKLAALSRPVSQMEA